MTDGQTDERTDRENYDSQDRASIAASRGKNGSPYAVRPLSVCNVGALWPNMIKMKLGMQVGLGPGHTVLDGDPAPLHQRGTAPQFSAHICCGQVAAWIKMSLGMEVGLCPGDFVLDGDPAPLPKRRQSPLNFRPIFIVAKWLDASRCHLVWR